MIVDYMSSDDLSKHLDRQMSIHAEKYREPEQDEEVDEVHVKALIKISFFSLDPEINIVMSFIDKNFTCRV